MERTSLGRTRAIDPRQCGYGETDEWLAHMMPDNVVLHHPAISPFSPRLPRHRRSQTRRCGAFYSNSSSDGCLIAIWLVIGNRPPPRPFEVVVLAVLERPEKSHQADETKRQRQWHEKYQDFHQPTPLAPRCARSAFDITSNDDPDIAAAATSGVARPAIASGTAKRL
jgi:hypothetical protein